METEGDESTMNRRHFLKFLPLIPVAVGLVKIPRPFDTAQDKPAESVTRQKSLDTLLARQKALNELIERHNERRVNEGVRHMAEVASIGLASEWTQPLATQLQGVDAAQPFVNAVATGDDTAVKEEARKLALAPIVELFDMDAIASVIEQKLRRQCLPNLYHT